MSTAADIPDFRSASGLYGSFDLGGGGGGGGRATGNGAGTPKKKEPSVRDLFDIKALTVSPTCYSKYHTRYNTSVRKESGSYAE